MEKSLEKTSPQQIVLAADVVMSLETSKQTRQFARGATIICQPRWRNQFFAFFMDKKRTAAAA